MTAAVSQRRLIALVSDGVRRDCAAPADQSLRQVLAAMGIPFNAQRHVVVSERGYEVDLDTPIETLADGSLLTVIDTVRSTKSTGSRATAPGASTKESPTLWWLLGTSGTVLTAGASIALLSGQATVATQHRALLSMALALAAVLSAGLWIARAKNASSSQAAVLFAPITLAFAAGVIATPSLEAAPHMAVVLGLASAAVVTTVLSVLARGREMRSVASTATVVLLVLVAVWGITLMLQWNATAAAALSMGLVAPGIVFIPATVMNFPEGYSINYVHFMSSRWTVRGVVPEDPGDITQAVVQPYLAESTARMTVGTALLSLVAVLTTPLVAPLVRSESLLSAIGAWVLLICTVLALLLIPRRANSRVTRWIPRIAATAVLLQLTLSIAAASENSMRVALAGALLVAGLIAVLVMTLVARGTRVLVWSRIADLVENMSVILTLPAAMLAAGTIEFVRTVVSG